jgi:CheY-like chemotaxis protein
MIGQRARIGFQPASLPFPATATGNRHFVRFERQMKNERKKLVAVLSDLMFTVKIQEAAKRAGIEPVFVKTETDALQRAEQEPAVIVIDLNYAGADPLDLIGKLKTNPQTSKVPLLAYVSHIQGDLKQAAQERGCDLVMARSAFSQNLPAILKRYA